MAEAATFETLVAAHVDLVYAAALRQVQDPHLADDVTQAVFLVMARKMEWLPPAPMLPAWLLKVTRYTALTAQRADRRRRRHELAAGVQAQGTATPEFHEQQIAALLDEALMALAEGDRQLIVLRYMRGMSLAETAEALRVGSNTAAKRVERALARMRRHFARRGVKTSAEGLAVAMPGLSTLGARPQMAGMVINAAAGGAAAAPAIAGGVPFGVWLMTISMQAEVAAVLAILLLLAGSSCLIVHAATGAPTPLAAVPASAPAVASASVAHAPATVPAGPVRLQFRVVDESGVPQAGVELTVMEDYSNFPVVNPEQRRWMESVTTEADGTAKATAPHAMPVNVLALHDGHAPLFLRAAEPYKQDVFPMTLRAGHTVKGVVRDANGDPIAGATVKVVPADFALIVIQDAVKPVATAKNGSFELPHVMEAKYTLTVEMPAEAAQWSASPVELMVAAGPAEVPLEIKAVAGVVVRGTIDAPPDIDLSKYQISASTRIPKRGQVPVKILEDKTFEIQLPPESIGTISFSETQDYSPAVTWKETAGFKMGFERIDFSYPKAGIYEGVKLELLKFAKATGRVVDQNGKPVAQVLVEPTPSNRIFRTDEDGNYGAKVPAYVAVRLQILGEQRVVDNQSGEEFKAEPGEEIKKDFTAWRVPAPPPHEQAIEGTVVDATGKVVEIEGLAVMLGNNGIVDEFARHPSRTQAVAGAFRFNQLAERETDLWVIDAKAGTGAFLPSVKTGTADAKLVMKPITERIHYSGQVLESTGAPAANARVMMLLSEITGTSNEDDQPALIAETRTDGQGYFNVEGVPRYATNPEMRLIVIPEKESMAWKFMPRMSVENLQIKLKPEITLGGRVFTPKGEPLAGAMVKLDYLGSREWGSIGFTRDDFEPARQAATTDAQGRYKIRGVAAGGRVQLSADAPEYGRNYALTLDAGERPLDVTLMEGITLEGNVVMAKTGQPVAGAKVTASGLRKIATVTTDERGHYQFTGIDHMAVNDPFLIMDVTAGEGTNLLEGSQWFTYSLYAGDRVRGLDVKVDTARSVRLAAWMTKAATKPAAAPSIVVLEDRDPAFRDQAAYHDTVTMFDGAGKKKWQLSTVNTTEEATHAHKVAVDPKDHAAWVCAGIGGILHVNAVGVMDWQKPELYTYAVAIDPATSNAWVAVKGEIDVLDAAGKLVATYAQQCNDIVYSPAEKCFWIKGSGVQKISTSGEALAQATVTFAANAPAMAVDEVDGTVWVSEVLHPQVAASKDRLLHLSREGAVLKELPMRCTGLAVDGKRKVVWVCRYGNATLELMRMDFDGTVQKQVPIVGASLALEPETGYVWAASREDVFRMSAEGEYVWHAGSEGNWEKWMAIVP